MDINKTKCPKCKKNVTVKIIVEMQYVYESTEYDMVKNLIWSDPKDIQIIKIRYTCKECGYKTKITTKFDKDYDNENYR